MLESRFLFQGSLDLLLLFHFFFVLVALHKLLELLGGAPSHIKLLDTDVLILVVGVLLGIFVLVFLLFSSLAVLLARHGHQLLLLLQLLLFTFDALLGLLVLGLDDGQG